ncbi:MAG: hypothetical protein ACRD3A_08275 [Terriglobales bacterium]
MPDGTLRLFRPGDQVHPARRGKAQPRREEIPKKYHYLLEWYEQYYAPESRALSQATDRRLIEPDPVLAMRGVGKEIWRGVDADAFVASLREGWSGE